MMRSESHQSVVKLQHDGSRSAFICGSTCLAISEAHTSRSALLDDVCSSSDGEFKLEIPLTLSQAQAWLEYVSFKLQGHDAETRASDATLLHALKAASFLQDDCTEELIVAELSTALEPEWATQKGKRRGQPAVSNQSRYHDPTPGQQARALEIAESTRTASLPAILAAVQPQPDTVSTGPTERNFASWQRLMDAAGYLLMLLPRSFHPVVMLARFPSIYEHNSLTILPFPWCGISAHVAPPKWPCLVDQALTAAAALCAGNPSMDLAPAAPQNHPANGALKRPRSPPSAAPIQHGTGSSTDGAGYCGVCAHTPGVGAAARGGDGAARGHEALTRLELGLISHSPACWRQGVARMRQLRELHLLVLNMEAACAPEMLCTAAELPALGGLHLYCKWSMAIDCPAVLDLFTGLTALSKLTALGLDNCFKAQREADYIGETMLRAVSGLSQLTTVKELSLKRCQMGVIVASCFGNAVRQLPLLQTLCVQNCSCGDMHATSLCGEAHEGFPSLRSLSAGGRYCADSEECEELAGALKCSTFLAGLTALRLRISMASAEGELLALQPPIAASLTDMTSLRSLMLPFCYLEDSGLMRLAEGLPEMQHLTQVDVSGSNASAVGVLAVLRAAAAAGSGGGGMRWLSVCYNSVSPEQGQEVARLLSGLPSLEEVAVGDSGLDTPGAIELLRWMRTLKQLRRVILLLDEIAIEDVVEFSDALCCIPALTRLELDMEGGDGSFLDCLQTDLMQVAPALCAEECDWLNDVIDGNPLNPFGYRLQRV